jgi:hypothetical protein
MWKPFDITVTYKHFTHLHTLESPTYISLTYTHYSHLHTLQSPTHISVTYIPFTHLHTLQSPTHITVTYTHYSHVHTLQSPTYFSLTYTHYSHLHTLQSPTYIAVTYIPFTHLHTSQSPTYITVTYPHRQTHILCTKSQITTQTLQHISPKSDLPQTDRRTDTNTINVKIIQPINTLNVTTNSSCKHKRVHYVDYVILKYAWLNFTNILLLVLHVGTHIHTYVRTNIWYRSFRP